MYNGYMVRTVIQHQREEPAYSRPVNLPDSLSENEASHFLKINSYYPVRIYCKYMVFFHTETLSE